MAVSDPDLALRLALGVSHRGAAQAACQKRAFYWATAVCAIASFSLRIYE